MSHALILFALASMPAQTDAGVAPEKAAPPGLSRFDRFLRYEQWVLDLCLSEKQRAEAKKLVDAVAPGSPDDEIVGRAAELYSELGTQTPTELARLRGSVEDEYVKRLKSRYPGKRVASWILKLRTESGVQVVAGKLPLTRRVAHCLADFSAFVVQQIGGPALPENEVLREGYAKELGVLYKQLGTPDREVLAAVPREWERLRALWEVAPDSKKEELRAGWRKTLPTPPPSDVKTLAAVALDLARALPGWQ